MNDQLTIPVVTRVGTSFVVDWAEGVKITCGELEKQKAHIEATITIEDFGSLGAPFVHEVRTFITKSWRNVVAELESISMRPDWRQRLLQLTRLVKRAFEEGSPAVALDRVAETEPLIQMMSIDKEKSFLWRSVPTIIYGPGGIGKSILGLNILQSIHSGTPIPDAREGREIDAGSVRQENCLWLDWETNEQLARWRGLDILRGRDILPGNWPDPKCPDAPVGDVRGRMVFYKEMVGSLKDNVKTLSDEISRLNIGTILIDSAIPACGGEAEKVAPSQAFFTALRAIKPSGRDLTTIIIAHVTKESSGAKSASSSSPFGSTVWKDRARDTFELIADQKKNATYTDFVLAHRKTNMGRLASDWAFRINWDQGCLMETIDIKENRTLHARTQGNADRAKLLIEEQGPMSTQEITDYLNDTSADTLTSKNTITQTLSRDDRFATNDGRWELSQLDF